MPYVGSTVSLLTLTLALAKAADEIQSKTFISVLDMANVQFADGLILESQARSTLDCLRMCSTQTCCNRFTLAASRATRGVCRCHRNAVSGTFALGSRTFIVSRNVRSGKARPFSHSSLPDCFLEMRFAFAFNSAKKQPFHPPDFFFTQVTYHNTCLLYTSPSPRDVHKSRMPSSA